LTFFEKLYVFDGKCFPKQEKPWHRWGNPLWGNALKRFWGPLEPKFLAYKILPGKIFLRTQTYFRFCAVCGIKLGHGQFEFSGAIADGDELITAVADAKEAINDAVFRFK
jgi:hypothetical protein